MLACKAGLHLGGHRQPRTSGHGDSGALCTLYTVHCTLYTVHCTLPRGGCADSLSQSLAVSLMGLGPTDVSKFVIGPLSPYTVQMLRHTR